MLGARLRARESSANPGCVHVNSLLMLASSRNTRICGRILLNPMACLDSCPTERLNWIFDREGRSGYPSQASVVLPVPAGMFYDQ